MVDRPPKCAPKEPELTIGAATQMVITVRRAPRDNRPGVLEVGDLAVLRGNNPAPVLHLQRLSGDLADKP